MGSFDDALDEAENMTNEQLASKITSIVKISQQNLQTFFPAKVDKEKLYTLIKIVRSSADENKKKQEIISKIGDYVGTILTLTKMFL